MKVQILLGILLLTSVGCSKVRTQPQTITSTTDADGALHPAQLRVSRAARVKCVFANGKDGSPAKCNVNGATTSPNDAVVVTERVYLFCEGSAPSKCAVRVEQ
jgi:hypothetical protein